MKRLMVMVLAFGLAASGAVAAATKGYKEVAAQEVKAMMETGEALVVFPLSRIEFDNLHITGSVNIPVAQLKHELPAKLDTPLIFYCLGMACTASPEASEIAVALGYTNVYAFRGGLPEWIAERYPVTTTHRLPNVSLNQISPADLQAALDRNEDLVLLDIRDDYSYEEQGWIRHPAHLAIHLDELHDREAEIPKNRKVVVICTKGKRAPAAVRYLVSLGFEEVVCLDGGMKQWLASGRPVHRGKIKS